MWGPISGVWEVVNMHRELLCQIRVRRNGKTIGVSVVYLSLPLWIWKYGSLYMCSKRNVHLPGLPLPWHADKKAKAITLSIRDEGSFSNISRRERKIRTQMKLIVRWHAQVRNHGEYFEHSQPSFIQESSLTSSHIHMINLSMHFHAPVTVVLRRSLQKPDLDVTVCKTVVLL